MSSTGSFFLFKEFIMKKNYIMVLSLSLLIAVLFAGCATGGREGGGGRGAPAVEIGRVFIDFSGFNGESPLVSHQPEQFSPETSGPFTLENGITGDGIRISHIGDHGGQPTPAEVVVEEMGGHMVVYSRNFIYFYIDNFEIREASNFIMNITFFDNPEGSNFIMHYVKGTGDDSYSPVQIPKRHRNALHTETVQLNNVNFNAAVQNQGAQFRFNAQSRINRVEIIAVEGRVTDTRFAAQSNDDF